MQSRGHIKSHWKGQIMPDDNKYYPPPLVKEIERETAAIGFTMASDRPTGSLLRTLAASKPAGLILELGTGTGLATAWMLDGMDERARLITVDVKDRVVAKRFLGQDARVKFLQVDGKVFIEDMLKRGITYDLIFADTPPGKFEMLAETLQLLKKGGIYVVDDLLPQPKWEKEHPPKVVALIDTLTHDERLRVTFLDWDVGILIAVRVG
jgi:predicted O-methyltransferase YrrM